MTDQPINLTDKRTKRAEESEQSECGDFKPSVSWDGIDTPDGFVQGLEAGKVLSALKYRKPERFAPIAARASNREFFERIAPQVGYDVEIEQSPDPYWIWPVFTRRTLEAVDSDE